MELQSSTLTRNRLGLSGLGEVSNMRLREFTAQVTRDAKKRGIPWARRAGEMSNFALNSTAAPYRDLKTYFESFNNVPYKYEMDLAARFPEEYRTGKVSAPKPKPEPKPEPSDPQPQTLPAQTTKAGFSLENVNPWWIRGGLLGVGALAIILSTK